MFDEALLNIIRGADPSDSEDLYFRVAITVTLSGTDHLMFGRQPDLDECRAAHEDPIEAAYDSP
jgi:hypothetical protein